MRLTGLSQYGKGLVQCETVLGETIGEKIERLKWSLWHGQVDKALGKIDDLKTLIEPLVRLMTDMPDWSRRCRSCARMSRTTGT